MIGKLSEGTPKRVIVIDIGGTYFRSSLFVGNQLENPQRVLTPNYINRPDLSGIELQGLIIDMIAGVVSTYRNGLPEVNIVGISFPGPVTSEGIVTQAPTVWGNKVKRFPLAARLSQVLPDTHFLLANDITAAAERYANTGKHRLLDYFAVVTISSGIGSKVYDVKNNTVILDKRSIGGEMGHIKVDFSPRSPVCGCGSRGHLAALSSGRAVERSVIEQSKKFPARFQKSYFQSFIVNPDNITNELIVRAIKAGDEFCLRILDQTTFPLACCIAQLSANIGVDKFIIIGGFALNCGQPYLQSLIKNLLRNDFFGRSVNEIPNLVELGINDDNDSLIGIGLLAQKSLAGTATKSITHKST